MERTVLVLGRIQKFDWILAGLVFAFLLGNGTAWAHKNLTSGSVGFSGNPVSDGTQVTITATLTYTGGTASGSATGHGTVPSAGTPVVGVSLRIHELQLGGVGVACGTAGAAFVQIKEATTDANGKISTLFDTTGLGANPANKICFRAQWPATAGSHGINADQGNGVDLEITLSGIPMPVSKLINGESATCTGAPPDANGNETEARTCTYTQEGLVLVAGDPRFEINVYTTENGLPGSTLLGGDPFPQPGVTVPPEFNIPGGIEIGTSFTMCEAPDLTTSPTPYTLTSVTIRVTGGLSAGTYNLPIYFVPTLTGNYACFNTFPTFPNGVPEGATEFAVDLNNSFVCTYSQGGYGGNPTNSPGYLKLIPAFGTLYPNGLQVGDKTGVAGFTNGWGLQFSSALAVNNSIPSTGPNKDNDALDQDYTDPPNGGPALHPGEFASQVTTLQLNVDLGGIGNYLLFTGAGNCGNGLKVSDVLGDANTALSGLSSSCSIGDLDSLAAQLTLSFHECVANPAFLLFTAPTPEQ